MSTFLNNLRFIVRQLLKRPGFTVIAILTLALGLTINAIVFSYVGDLYLRPLETPHPEKLVRLFQRSPQVKSLLDFSYPDFYDIRLGLEDPNQHDPGLTQAFSGVAAYRRVPVHIGQSDRAQERSWLQMVSNNYFDVLALKPMLGRFFLTEEGMQAGKDPIVVLTHDYWQRRCHSDPDIIGQTIEICCLPMTVVGVTPPGFYGMEWSRNLSGFAPISMMPQLTPFFGRQLSQRNSFTFQLCGRLQADVSPSQAQSSADVLFTHLLQQYPDEHLPGNIKVLREPECRPTPALARTISRTVKVLMGLSLLVLIVAAVNFTNLLYTRMHERQQEIAVRRALGAGRCHLFSQLLWESVLLASGAALVGLLVTPWVRMALDRLLLSLNDALPIFDHTWDWRQTVFTFVLALLVAVLACTLSSLRILGLQLVPLLKEGGSRGSTQHFPLRKILVITQIALSCLVLICACLAARSLQKLASVDLGFNEKNLLLASYNLGTHRYVKIKGFAKAVQFHQDVLTQAQGLPGVQAATLVEHAPYSDEVTWLTDYLPEGQVPKPDQELLSAPCHKVAETFMQTFEIPILTGRDFTPNDNDQNAQVIIINQAMADCLWPDGDALNKRLRINGELRQVVGIVPNGCYYSMTDPTQPYAFIPLRQGFVGNITLALRTTGDPMRYIPMIEQLIRKIEPGMPIYNVLTMQQQIAGSPLGLMPLRIGATIVGIQGALAMFLAVVGLYGLITTSTAQRTQEIGIRLALGACPHTILLMVLRQGALLTAVGLGFGLFSALIIGYWLRHLLYNISSADIVSYLVTSAVLSITTLIACAIPAYRATKIDPMEALRCE
jgi:putative ABC transport system permease protein